MMLCITLPVLFFCLLCSVDAGAALQDLGTFGATYPILEKDGIEEIKQKAAETDWSKYFNRERIEKAVKGYRPENIVRLPRATEDRTFRVDMTYTLNFDIHDGKGGILYPKGYTFNPLDYIHYHNVLVVIDASDEEQLAWLKSCEYMDDYRTRFLITDGGFWDLSNSLERAVFYANEQIVRRLKLKAVPSVVRQSGRFMEVKEIAIESHGETDKDHVDSGGTRLSISAE